MIKAVMILDDILGFILNKYSGKEVSIRGNNYFTVVKANRAWRKKRHLKALYRVDGYMTYSGYRLKRHELILSPLNDAKYTPPPGGYAEWTPL